MSDLIYRHDAIKAIETSRFLVDAKEKVMLLPSAQPELAQNLHNACTDLISRQAAIDAIFEAFSTGDEGADRYIAEKILANVPSAQPEYRLDEWCTDCKEYDQTAHCCHRFTKVIRQAVEEVKAEQPERKKGKWIKPTGMMPPEYMGVYRCSECGEIAMRDWKRHYQTLTNYCPNCGAKMEGD